MEHILQQVNMEEEFLESFYGREADISSEDEDEGESNDTRRAPPGWKLERSTKVKRFFYFNVESRLKYWQDESLPYGWAIEYSEGGHKKYVNMITGESTLNKPHRKNQISPDALAKQRGKSTSSMSHNGGRGSLGGSGSSNSSSSGDGGGAGTGSDSKQRQRSGSTGSVGSTDVWKLVFSEKFKQRYYFNARTKKQFWRVENTPEGWAFEWNGKSKRYFNVFTGEKANEPPELTTKEQEEQVEKEEGEIEDGEITEDVRETNNSNNNTMTTHHSGSGKKNDRVVDERLGRKRDTDPRNRGGHHEYPKSPPRSGERRGYSRSRSRSPLSRGPPPTQVPLNQVGLLPPPLPPPPPSLPQDHHTQQHVHQQQNGQQSYYNDNFKGDHHQQQYYHQQQERYEQHDVHHHQQHQQYSPQQTQNHQSGGGGNDPWSNRYHDQQPQENYNNGGQWGENHGHGDGGAAVEEGEIEIDYTRR